jgi:hypothetical protein
VARWVPPLRRLVDQGEVGVFLDIDQSRGSCEGVSNLTLFLPDDLFEDARHREATINLLSAIVSVRPIYCQFEP